VTGILTRMRTALALGPRNIVRVLTYRLLLRAGVHAVQRVAIDPAPTGPFFADPRARSALTPATAWRESAHYFGWATPPLPSGPPHWHQNPLTGAVATGTERPWWEIPDFDPALGDIKVVWEASRLDWAMVFAQRVAAGDTASLDRLNSWLADWCAKNPPYLGHNWKCGQEASIRVMHLAVAALVLRQAPAALPALRDLLVIHLRRIAPTMSYAIGQDNNHGTSEAAALFIGGSWLHSLGHSDGSAWMRDGRQWLEERVQRLIARDGSFSQYSVNYHRLLLDTLSLVERWREQMALPRFPDAYQRRVQSAADWLRGMVDPATGDAPNIGANDGANLLPLTDADARDFRPSVQLGTALFSGSSAYAGPGPWESHLAWLGVAMPVAPSPSPSSRILDDGGYAILNRGDAVAVFRYPRFRFRPSHADMLHVDLRVGSDNLLRDGGTYSYAGDFAAQAPFVGAQGHNTVEFDDREAMPRLGRFLWGDWARTAVVRGIDQSTDRASVGAAFVSGGATHDRQVDLYDNRLIVRDRVSGFARRAVLRWRLQPGAWAAINGGQTPAASARSRNHDSGHAHD
jgi:hypothetical protein